MTDRQYSILLDLYHEYNEAFQSLPNSILRAFYVKLQHGKIK